MPSSEVILSVLTATANEWRALAIFWHVFVGTLLLAIATGRGVSNRLVGYLLVLPLISVSGLAWISGNPFNGVMFAAFSLLLAGSARRFPGGKVQVTSNVYVGLGLLFVAFGWIYPHFVEAKHWTDYVVAAPLGLLPCPTLSAVIGITLMVGPLRPTAWNITLCAAGLLYGVIGVFRLGVMIDLGLLAGTALLAHAVISRLNFPKFEKWVAGRRSARWAQRPRQ